MSFFGAGACVLLLSGGPRAPWLLLALATLQGAFADMLWCNVYVYLGARPPRIKAMARGPPASKQKVTSIMIARSATDSTAHPLACYSRLIRACAAEAFPTSIRSTAFGLAMGVGRSGGVASSALGGALGSDRVQLAFVLYGAAFIVGGFSVCCFGLETSGRPLRDAVV